MSLLSIDFGISYCAAAYLNAAAQPIPICFGVNEYNSKLYKFPTVIQYAKNINGCENKIIGELALSNLIQSNRQDSSIISKIKTELREQNGYYVNGKIKKSVEIVSDIFQKIKDISEKQSGECFDDVIITHPAHPFESTKKQLLVDAAKRSGFTNVSLLDEPIAASYAFIKKHDIPTNTGSVVFDYGGGTIDVAYLWYDENKKITFKFPPQSKSECGGEYIDLLLHNFICEKLGSNENQFIVPILLDHCSRMKINFAESSEETIYHNGKAITLSYDDFVKIIRPKTEIAINLFKNIIKKCNDLHLQIDNVFLNGGSSRLRLVKKTVEISLPGTNTYFFGGDDLAVAIGALLYSSGLRVISTPNNRIAQVTYKDPILTAHINKFKNT